ncbi:MAG: MBL fold metallo-hydrolase [bacterium]
MKLKFWGVRGSVPAPGKDTVKYGGNTSCVDLRSDTGELFILDAGTGIRKLGNNLMAEDNPLKLNILLSHVHWDHIEGLPFFKPLYFKRYHIDIIGCFDNKRRVKDVINFALHQPYFPVSLGDLKSEIEYKDITENSFNMGGLHIDVLPVNHPAYTVAYRFSEGQKKVIYMTDNELFCQNNVSTPYEKIVEFCTEADVLIHDAMYTTDEWNTYKGWGHSSISNALQLGIDARVQGLFLFHHDPERTDKEETQIIKECHVQIKKAKSKVRCEGAMEGSEIII